MAATAFVEEGEIRLAVVSASSPLLDRAPSPDEGIALSPIRNARSLDEAADLANAGALACGPEVVVSAQRLVSPVDGRSPFVPFVAPRLATAAGIMSPGVPREAAIGRVYDMATDKGSPVIPVHSVAQIVGVEGGVALSMSLSSPIAGARARMYGLVVHLGEPGSPGRTEPPRDLSAAEIREALDRRDGALAEGDVLRARAEGYGEIARVVVAGGGSAESPVTSIDRSLVAHAVALGLPIWSIALSELGTMDCVVLCGRQILPVDRSYLDHLFFKDREALRDERRRLDALEIALLAASFSSVLVPTGRRGFLSRPEILEDALIIGEGILVGLTTPVFLEARLPRARPIRFHPEGTRGAASLGPAFTAMRTTRATSAAGAAATLLFIEEARLEWAIPASIGLVALAGLVAVFEVRAGLAFPSDVPLGAIDGLLAGAGTVLWHHLFWRGWPEDDRGSLPLRLHGLSVSTDSDRGVYLGMGGSFE